MQKHLKENGNIIYGDLTKQVNFKCDFKSKNNINNNTNNISGGGGRYYQNHTISLPYNLFSTNPLLTSSLQKKCVS
ncbi:hypothetical protein [Helicobacter pullorum]|uniref:Uncharacterized protein n=1 Tax=Helicobacter pullorum TaxID=35818 RepID=A0A377Q2Z7_9HELI|nr:hypothetical protein [Helicobacter pullorum]STQ88203.1 Uncharacterised protein [Helicobacter pullorum]